MRKPYILIQWRFRKEYAVRPLSKRKKNENLSSTCNVNEITEVYRHSKKKLLTMSKICYWNLLNFLGAEKVLQFRKLSSTISQLLLLIINNQVHKHLLERIKKIWICCVFL